MNAPVFFKAFLLKYKPFLIYCLSRIVYSFRFTCEQKFEPSFIFLFTHVGQRSFDDLPQPGVSQDTKIASEVDILKDYMLDYNKKKQLIRL